ncbi:MAG: hypothetical protein KGD64_15425 [Candidatus Heimdallarchaeota archaeon]|nr:hypothetical protein [Candidatus Heimdallarchaeota archaeon]
MITVKSPITTKELKQIAKSRFGNLIKAVVDVEKGIMVIDSDLHSDEEAVLIEQGSEQKDLWGINLYPDEDEGSFIEFDSMINLRPSQNNLSRGVENEKTRKRIANIVNKFVTR